VGRPLAAARIAREEWLAADRQGMLAGGHRPNGWPLVVIDHIIDQLSR